MVSSVNVTLGPEWKGTLLRDFLTNFREWLRTVHGVDYEIDTMRRDQRGRLFMVFHFVECDSSEE